MESAWLRRYGATITGVLVVAVAPAGAAPDRATCASQTVTGHRTWTVRDAARLTGCQVTVSAGAGLSLAPGATATGVQLTVSGTLTLGPGDTLAGGSLVTVAPHASLTAAGTARRPVRFSGGSWVIAEGSNSIRIDHAVFSGDHGYAVREVQCAGYGPGEMIELESSSFSGQVDLGSCDGDGGDRIAVEGNTFRVPVGITALSVEVPDLHRPARPGRLTVRANAFEPVADFRGYPVPIPPAPEVAVSGWPVTGFALAGAATNRFTGSGPGKVVSVTYDTVPSGASWTVSPAGGEVLDPLSDYTSNPGLAVSGVLNLEPGLIVKVGAGVMAGHGFGIDLGPDGSLVALGTAARPIVFTSMNDATVGGNSSGTSAMPTQSGYIWAVQADEGSSVDVSHAVFRHGWYAFYDACSVTPQNGGRFGLTDSLVADEISLGDCDGSQHGYVPELVNDTFDFNGSPSGNFAAGGGYDPAAQQPALLLFNVDPSFVDLSGAGSNHFTGRNAGLVVALAGTTIHSGQRWTVAPSSGAVLAPWVDTNYLTSPGLTVDGTLDLEPGVTVKSAMPGVAIDVGSAGTLDVAGTTTLPVVFTAIADDAVAGDSNGDGSRSAPRPGSYGTAIQFEGWSGGPTVSHAVFEYANDAVSFKAMSHSATFSASDWVDNVAAFEVEETSGPDYEGIGNAPCVPPWLVSVISDDNWFGPDGHPAPDIDLGSFVGVVLPGKIPLKGTAYNVSGMGPMISEEHAQFGKGDTVPWAIYSCAEPPIKALPMTPIAIGGVPSGPHFAAFEPHA